MTEQIVIVYNNLGEVIALVRSGNDLESTVDAILEEGDLVTEIMDVTSLSDFKEYAKDD